MIRLTLCILTFMGCTDTPEAVRGRIFKTPASEMYEQTRTALSMAEVHHLTWGLTPFVSSSGVDEQYKPTISLVAEQLRIPIRTKTGESYEHVEEMLLSGKIDIALMSPYAYVRAKAKARVPIHEESEEEEQRHNVEDEGDRLFVYAVFAPVDYRAGVVNGRNISLAAELDYSDQLLHRLNQTAPPDLTFRVVEPNLTTRIDYAAFEPVDAGDVVNFTITVAHNGESTAAAYDLVLVAQVHPDLDILSGDGGSHAATHNISQDLKYITYTLDVLPLSDPVLVVTFDAVVLNSMVPTEVDVVALQNVTYDSHLREQRFGLGGRFDVAELIARP